MNIIRNISFIVICFVGVIGLANSQDTETTISNLPGHIAYVGEDHNIYTISPSTAEVYQLSNDATGRARYEFPTWSPDGQLAYFCCSVRGLQSPKLSIFISPDGMAGGEEFYVQNGARHVYAYWSPATCADDECVDLAVLIQDLSRRLLGVELFNSHNKEDGQRSLGEGQPFYYSWSPSGDSLLMYRNNRTLQYYSVETADIDVAFSGDLGNFLSPGWSPVDDRILFASSDHDVNQLTLMTDGESEILVDDIEGIISFSWSPDGKYIAYRVASRNNISSVYVIDSFDGEVIARSNITGVFSFFWSPNSEKIAYLTLANPPGTFDINNQTSGNVNYLTQNVDGFAWNILNIDDSSNDLLASFIPSISMQYLLTNFDQFAQSHSIWSPDSSHIVYSELGGSSGRESFVMILNVNDNNAAPIMVAEGSFAIWSYK